MDIELENKYLKHETLSIKADLIMAKDRIKYLEHEVDILTKEIDKYAKTTFGNK